jgi:hypothetical protein
VIVPASGEVLAEEIQSKLDESLPREEQGEVIRRYVRMIADELAAAVREAHAVIDEWEEEHRDD